MEKEKHGLSIQIEMFESISTNFTHNLSYQSTYDYAKCNIHKHRFTHRVSNY